MPSAEHQTLVQAIAGLKADLMNFQPSPTVPYSNSDLLKCQAFVVFSHAEMQVYWEAVARRILSEAENRWKTSSVVDRAIGTLVAFRRPEQVSVPVDPLNPHRGGNFTSIVEEAVKTHNEVIGDNNGIKRANIANLLVPLGVMPGDFVEKLLIQLDQTGKKRGDMVHKSSKVSIRNIRDPFTDEMKDIDELVIEIGHFDAKLVALGLLSP
ncbi:MAG: hypothetical protein CL534_12110 [Ahrensia sp.]|nr:hypothetical protein [Ahrensia sp.]